MGPSRLCMKLTILNRKRYTNAPAGSRTAASTPTIRSNVCCQYANSTASTPDLTGDAPRRDVRRRWPKSSVDVSEDEVEAPEDCDHVGDVDAAGDPRDDRHVVERRRPDLHAERADVA